MPHYYLTGWKGTGTAEDWYRPAIDPTGGYGVDLRPDSSQVAGLVLVPTAEQVPTPKGSEHLGNDPAAELPLPLRTRIGNALGVTLAAATLRGIVLEILTDHARTDGTRWRPLTPLSRGPNRWEIHLGGLFYSVPRIAGGATWSESFDKADGTTLGPDLTWTEIAGDYVIATNAASHAGANKTRHRARAEHDTAGSVVFAQGSCELTAGGYNDIMVSARWDPAANTHYVAAREFTPATSSYGYDLRKFVNGTETRFGSVTRTIAKPAGAETIRLEVDGTTLKMFLDGVEAATATDSSIAGDTQRRGGISSFRGAGEDATWVTKWHSFSFGDLGAAATNGAPTSIGSTVALGGPMAATTASASPAGITSTATPNAPTASATVGATPGSLGLTVTIAAPTATVGTVGATPSSISSTVALGSPSTGSAANGAPTSITSTATLGAPTAATLTAAAPTGISSTVALGSPSTGNVTDAQPASISSTIALGSPTAGVVGVVAPDSLAVTITAGSPAAAAGSVNGAPTGIANAVTLGSPEGRQITVGVPTTIDLAAAANSPAALVGLVGATPTTVDLAVQVGVPTAADLVRDIIVTVAGPYRRALTAVGPRGRALTVTGPRS